MPGFYCDSAWLTKSSELFPFIIWKKGFNSIKVVESVKSCYIFKCELYHTGIYQHLRMFLQLTLVYKQESLINRNA